MRINGALNSAGTSLEGVTHTASGSDNGASLTILRGEGVASIPPSQMKRWGGIQELLHELGFNETEEVALPYSQMDRLVSLIEPLEGLKLTNLDTPLTLSQLDTLKHLRAVNLLTDKQYDTAILSHVDAQDREHGPAMETDMDSYTDLEANLPHTETGRPESVSSQTIQSEDVSVNPAAERIRNTVRRFARGELTERAAPTSQPGSDAGDAQAGWSVRRAAGAVRELPWSVMMGGAATAAMAYPLQVAVKSMNQAMKEPVHNTDVLSSRVALPAIMMLASGVSTAVAYRLLRTKQQLDQLMNSNPPETN